MKVHLLAGVACFGLCVGLVGDAAAEEAAPAPQQGCSGLSCLFGSGQGQRQPTAAETKALQDNQRAAEAEGAGNAASKGRSKRAASGNAKTGAPATKTADASDDDAKAKPKKAVHTVTIAAEGSELKKLQGLAAALPKEKVKIVKVRGDGTPKTDFTISNALEPAADGEKAKLFTEQLHIVAGGTVKSVADLNGKVVSFGPDKSPGQLAARKAFEALNVKVNETPLDVDNALDGLSSGDVDAVVMLAPQPIDRLKTVQAEGVHLVAWPEGGTLPSGATAATIDASAYPGLAKPGETIRAVGVDALLTMSARGSKQGAAKSFLKSLSDNAAALTKRGFDLLKADLATRQARHLASVDKS